jgi:hypothetical protein
MAGYSGTPLPKKLGIKPQFRVAFFELPGEIKTTLKEALSDCQLVRDGHGQLDFAMIFIKSQAAMKQRFAMFARRLTPAGMLWVSWPKTTSGLATDLNENDVRRIGLVAGLVDVKVCAVSEVWSGLKFVIRVKDRSKAGG